MAVVAGTAPVRLSAGVLAGSPILESWLLWSLLRAGSPPVRVSSSTRARHAGLVVVAGLLGGVLGVPAPAVAHGLAATAAWLAAGHGVATTVAALVGLVVVSVPFWFRWVLRAQTGIRKPGQAFPRALRDAWLAVAGGVVIHLVEQVAGAALPLGAPRRRCAARRPWPRRGGWPNRLV